MYVNVYTLSHPENDRDVTDRAKGYTLQDASFVRQSRDSLLNSLENTCYTRVIISIYLWNTRWRHGRSRGETKYRTTRCCTWFNSAWVRIASQMMVLEDVTDMITIIIIVHSGWIYNGFSMYTICNNMSRHEFSPQKLIYSCSNYLRWK